VKKIKLQECMLVLLCLIMPMILIPILPTLYFLESVLDIVIPGMLLISPGAHMILTIGMSFIICIFSKRHGINKWFGFIVYAICVIVASFLGVLMIYIGFLPMFKMTTVAYLLLSSIGSVTPCAIYLVFMLIQHRKKNQNV